MRTFVPPSRRSLLRESRFALIAPLAALVAYFPAIVVPYGFMDDYYLLAWQRGLEGEFWKTATQFGRPLHALFLSGAFGLASDIGGLRLVRLLGLLGVMLLALFLYYVLREAGVGRWLSTGICVSVVSLASFQIYVSWAAIFEAPYVAVLAGLASLRLRSASGLEGRRAHIRRGEAAALLLCALLSYQPAAMFFWVFTAIDVLRPDQELARALRKFGESLAVAAVALFFGYVAVRIGVHFYGGAFAGRTNLVHDFVGKARWFWNEPIVNSLGMFNLIPTASAAFAIAVVSAIGILLLHSESGPRALGFLGLAVAFVPLSYTPNLVISENFASYRSTAALATLVTLYLWFGLWGIARALTSSARPARRRVVKLVFVLALAALASFAALALVVVPLLRPLEQVSVHTLTSGPELAAFALLFIILRRHRAVGDARLGSPDLRYGRGRSRDDRVRARRRTDRREERHHTCRETAECGIAAGAIGAQQRAHARPAPCRLRQAFLHRGRGTARALRRVRTSLDVLPLGPESRGPTRPARAATESASCSHDPCLGPGSGVERRAGRRVRGHAGAGKAPRRVELLDAPRSPAHYTCGGGTFRATTVTMSNRFNGRL